ncbi:hypothetical protein MW887_002295 [Aspergillus wentii]|nr:hypothetical protein MW887_002295 [Aspergillus wentii]
MVLENPQHRLYNHELPTTTTTTTTLPQPQSKTSSRPSVIRKKFAKPPVKVACLACKRGGPRKKKTSISPERSDQQDGFQNEVITPTSNFNESSGGMFGQIDVLSVPGAGLRSLDFSSDVQSMFVDLFPANEAVHTHVQMEPTPSPSNEASQFLVRTYSSEHEILNAYYDFIHLYFPILPPRINRPCPDRPLNCAGSCADSPSEEPILLYRPQSPLSLAISAILALIPHPNDPEPTSAGAVLQRRTYAHTFAQLANNSIEADCELHASSTEPAQALSNDRPLINREPFHINTPVELERILALLVLSVYEYTQRGNLLKMRYRAGQALAIALDMSLHSLGEEFDEFAEARRRTWWMTYYCVLQGSIVSTTPPSITLHDPQFVTPYPRFASDPDGWSILIQAQQVIVSSTQFIIDLNKCIRTGSNWHYIYERMQQLDAWSKSILAQSNLPPINCGDQTEAITAQSIRAISRIKLSSAQIKTHRFRAFSDIPIFIKKHCDLTAASSNNANVNNFPKASRAQSGISSIQCSCSSMEPFQSASSSDYTGSSASSTPSDAQSIPQYPFRNDFPYTSQQSAKVCLRAAFLISHMFSSLPLPEPLYVPGDGQETPLHQPPRTMPSFACCLMQGSYALLMIFYKARVAKQLSPGFDYDNTGNPSDRLVEELRQGLGRLISAVGNYAIAFEALDGMRDEIAGAYQTAFPQV